MDYELEELNDVDVLSDDSGILDENREEFMNDQNDVVEENEEEDVSDEDGYQTDPENLDKSAYNILGKIAQMEDPQDGRIILALQKTSWLQFKNDVINEIINRYDSEISLQEIVLIRPLLVEHDKFGFWCRMTHELQTHVRNIIPNVSEFNADGMLLYIRKTSGLVNINVTKLSTTFYKIIVHVRHNRYSVRVS